ncbi:MAG: TolC family protein [Pseudomonadota bacterium]
MRIAQSILATTLLAVLSVGCVAPVPETLRDADALPRWERADLDGEVSTAWLSILNDPALSAVVNRAIEENFALGQEAARVEQAWFTLKTTNAARLPSVSLTLDGSRRRIGAGPQNNNFGGSAGGAPIDSFGLGLDITWQADVWGELSAASRSAALTYAAAEASFINQRRLLAANVSRAWYALAAACEQVTVVELQVENARESLDIVESGYRAGLNEALDVYLARNVLAQAENNLAAQRQTQKEQEAQLQLLLAANPGQTPDVEPRLTDIDDMPGVGIPSELTTRRADLQQAWLNLLAANADLAVAHKQRFPSLTLRAGSSDSADLFPDVFDGTPLGWTLIGTVIQPLFEGGRRKANVDRSKARLKELELRYLEVANAAFAEVENAISQQQALAERYAAAERALDSAEIALGLSLEQYQRGLVNYATVLESQTRAFDARAAIVTLKNQRLQSRIDLFVALGGAFGPGDRMEARL